MDTKRTSLNMQVKYKCDTGESRPEIEKLDLFDTFLLDSDYYFGYEAEKGSFSKLKNYILYIEEKITDSEKVDYKNDTGKSRPEIIEYLDDIFEDEIFDNEHKDSYDEFILLCDVIDYLNYLENYCSN